MTLRKLTVAAAFTIAAGLALPAAAEAGHHHSRSCGHGYHGGSYNGAYYNNGGYYGRGYAPGYGYNGYRYYKPYYPAYGYGYYRPYGYVRPYPAYPVYPAPVYPYYSRPHVSIHLDF